MVDHDLDQRGGEDHEDRGAHHPHFEVVEVEPGEELQNGERVELRRHLLGPPLRQVHLRGRYPVWHARPCTHEGAAVPGSAPCSNKRRDGSCQLPPAVLLFPFGGHPSSLTIIRAVKKDGKVNGRKKGIRTHERDSNREKEPAGGEPGSPLHPGSHTGSEACAQSYGEIEERPAGRVTGRLDQARLQTHTWSPGARPAGRSEALPRYATPHHPMAAALRSRRLGEQPRASDRAATVGEIAHLRKPLTHLITHEYA